MSSSAAGFLAMARALGNRAGYEAQAGRRLEPDRLTGAPVFKNRMSVPILALRAIIAHCGGWRCIMADRPEMPPPEAAYRSYRIGWTDSCSRKDGPRGDRIVIVAGLSMSTPGTMNNLVIQTVGESSMQD